MMDLDTVLQALRELLPDLQREHHVEALGVFGSLARGESRAGSDVDVFVRFASNACVTLVTMARVQNAIETKLGVSVDLVDDHDRLSQPFRRSVEQDLIRVA